MEPDRATSKQLLKQTSIEEALEAGRLLKLHSTIQAPAEKISSIPQETANHPADHCNTRCEVPEAQFVSGPEHVHPLDAHSPVFKHNESQDSPVNTTVSAGECSLNANNVIQSPIWLGEALMSLKAPYILLHTLIPKPGHRIFFSCSENGCNPQVPYPSSYTDNWSEQYVRMPCSPESLYPVIENGKKSLIVRWSLIERSLRKPISSSQQLQEAILSYNERFKSSWNFSVLHDVIANDFPDGDANRFFQSTLPGLCAMALKLPVYLTQPIPLMRAGCESSFTFSQLQIASLLANAFFCTFPRRNSRGRNAEFAHFPSINFSSLFSGPQNRCSIPISKREKLRCLLHYFRRVIQTMPTGTITYTRRCLGNMAPNWAESTKSFDRLRIHINADSTIEEAGMNTLQVDFANRFLGGGVLNHGCVQEEIMFVLRPELLAGRLFIESLNDDEAVVIEGAETYSRSSGYADTFRWIGDYNEAEAGTTRDEWGRCKTTVVAIDAMHFRSTGAQFTPAMIKRELNKAYYGFTGDLSPGRKLPSVVATGNWGCGAFRGNVDLKALIQMMACVQSDKSLAYFTFGDKALLNRLYDMYLFLSSNSVTVGRLWEVLMTLDNAVKENPGEFYEYIKQRLHVLT